MKSTTTRPDGTREELDGSPSELAEYHRLSGGESDALPPFKMRPPSPEEVRLGLEQIKEALRLKRASGLVPPVRWEHDPSCQVVQARSGWWSVDPPRCTCGLVSYPVPLQLGTITSDNTNIG